MAKVVQFTMAGIGFILLAQVLAYLNLAFMIPVALVLILWHLWRVHGPQGTSSADSTPPARRHLNSPPPDKPLTHDERQAFNHLVRGFNAETE